MPEFANVQRERERERERESVCVCERTHACVHARISMRRMNMMKV